MPRSFTPRTISGPLFSGQPDIQRIDPEEFHNIIKRQGLRCSQAPFAHYPR